MTNTNQEIGRSIASALNLKTKRPLNRADRIVLTDNTGKRRRRHLSTGRSVSSSSSSSGYHFTGSLYSRPTSQFNSDNDDDHLYDDDNGSFDDRHYDRSARDTTVGLSQSYIPISFDYDEEVEDHVQGDHVVGQDNEEAEEVILPAYMQQAPNVHQVHKKCYLCGHFCQTSENAIIQRMWKAFWDQFWLRSLESLAKMLHKMYVRMIWEVEVEIEGNPRNLPRYHWRDFYHHIVDPDHMGLSFTVTQRKLITQTIKNIEACQNFVRFTDDDGNVRLDTKVLNAQTQMSKHLIDLYRLDAKDMVGHSTDAVADSSKLGAFARIF